MQTNGLQIATVRDLQLANTGERLLTETCDSNTIEHLHRYALALAFCQDKDVLDIASGEGYGSNLIANVAKSVRGVDISSEAVSHAAAKYQRTNLTFIEGSASEIPLETAAVDVVSSFETIEHHSRHTEMMSEIKRVLRPGGLLIISSPDKLLYSDILHANNPYHVKELYKEEFRSLLTDHFRYVEMLLQRVVYGSLISPESGARGFADYWGNYEEICSSDSQQKPLYNLCVASDEPVPPQPVSIFEGGEVVEVLRKSLEAEKEIMRESFNAQREQDLEFFANSQSYRLGRALTWPIRRLLRK